jgi:nicotinamidase/pyrazinamidase
MTSREDPMLTSHDALIAVDPQVDFFPGGALAVADGDQILRPTNRVLRRFAERGLPIFVTRDWHPPDHCSFQANGGPWPPHCVRGTAGAELHPDLELPAIVTLVQKATRPDWETYSDFDGTGLAEELAGRGVRRVFVVGLALDYCVRATCLDAARAGLEVVLLTDATRAVEVEPGDGERALGELAEAGVQTMAGVPE